MNIKQLARFIFLWWGQIDGDGLLSAISNGFCIQFYSQISGNQTVYTLPIAYSTGNYTVIAALISSNNDTVRSWHAWTFNKTTTTFAFMDKTSGLRQIITAGY